MSGITHIIVCVVDLNKLVYTRTNSYRLTSLWWVYESM